MISLILELFKDFSYVLIFFWIRNRFPKCERRSLLYISNHCLNETSANELLK
jgi:hypothetical protein